MLNSALVYRNDVAAQLSPSDPKFADKVYLIDAADRSLDQADKYYQTGQNEEGNIAQKLAVGFVDAVLSFAPGVSWGRDLYEALTGKDMVYGTDLDTLDRTLAIVGAATVGVGSKLGKGMKVLAEIATSKVVLNAGKYKDAIGKAERITHSAEKFEVPAENVRKYAIDLANPPRKNHILYGEITPRGYSGGHMHPGQPGKTVFPQNWTGDKIMHETSDIVTDPSVIWKRNGVDIQPLQILTKKDDPHASKQLVSATVLK